MSQGENLSPRQSTWPGESSTTGRDSARSKADEWSDVKDPNERRKIQNKLAQRRFRE